jgi:hypothetical protein
MAETRNDVHHDRDQLQLVLAPEGTNPELFYILVPLFTDFNMRDQQFEQCNMKWPGPVCSPLVKKP